MILYILLLLFVYFILKAWLGRGDLHFSGFHAGVVDLIAAIVTFILILIHSGVLK